MPMRSSSCLASAIVVAAVLLGLGALWPATARAQSTFDQAYGNSFGGPIGGPGIMVTLIEGSGFWANEERGAHAALFFGAPESEISAGVEGFGFWQRKTTGGLDERMWLVRVVAGYNVLELYKGGLIRIDAGAAFGEHLIGRETFADFTAGALLSLPIPGDDGFPILRADVSYVLTPIRGFTRNFLFGARLSIYPIPGGPLRPLGIQGGYYFGADDHNPYNAILVGIVFGGPT